MRISDWSSDVCSSDLGLHLERTPLALAAVLGIMMHGASYVPLDLDAPEDRKAFIASEAKLAAIVSGQADIVAGMVPIVVDLALTPVHDAALLPDPGIVPGDEVSVIFTSGPTGPPKGVAIQPRNHSYP